MAQEDKAKYEQFKHDFEQALEVMKEVLPALSKSKILLSWIRNTSNYVWVDSPQNIDFTIISFKKEMNNKLSELENYMHCAHINTKKVDKGHDSHKNYYAEVCENCGKEIREWDV